MDIRTDTAPPRLRPGRYDHAHLAAAAIAQPGEGVTDFSPEFPAINPTMVRVGDISAYRPAGAFRGYRRAGRDYVVFVGVPTPDGSPTLDPDECPAGTPGYLLDALRELAGGEVPEIDPERIVDHWQHAAQVSRIIHAATRHDPAEAEALVAELKAEGFDIAKPKRLRKRLRKLEEELPERMREAFRADPALSSSWHKAIDTIRPLAARLYTVRELLESLDT